MYLAAVRLILRFGCRLLSAARSAERAVFCGFLPFAVLEVRSLSCSQALVKYFSARLRAERAAFDRLVLEGQALVVQSNISEVSYLRACGPNGRLLTV